MRQPEQKTIKSMVEKLTNRPRRELIEEVLGKDAAGDYICVIVGQDPNRPAASREPAGREERQRQWFAAH
ncbi:MAG: hypothetical protein IPG66_12205 [Hydrogenophilales bacterium]|nr:hypothetical protein [Hydrogenophilales bacterium]